MKTIIKDENGNKIRINWNQDLFLGLEQTEHYLKEFYMHKIGSKKIFWVYYFNDTEKHDKIYYISENEIRKFFYDSVNDKNVKLNYYNIGRIGPDYLHIPHK